MNCFPLIERELHLALRRRYGNYKIRWVCAAGSMAAAFWILFVWSAWNPTAGFGRPFLHLLSSLGYASALAAGVVLLADSISREKREGTLDLLLLTDLQARDVVLGKLLANLIVPIYGFMAMVPALELSVLVGGTTAGECARMLLIWTNALFFSFVLSSLVSAIVREQRTAHLGCILVLLIAAVGIPYLGATLTAQTGNPFWRALALDLSPTGPYRLADPYSLAPAPFWTALLANQACCAVVLALTYVGLQRTISARMRGPVPESRRLHSPNGRTPARKPRQRAELLDSKPVQWLAERTLGRPAALWALGIAAWSIVFIPPKPNDEPLLFVLLATIHMLVKLVVATSATHAFIPDRRSGALESLLATPIDATDVASGMCKQLRRRFAGPVFLLAGATVLIALRILQSSGGSVAQELASVLIFGAILLPVDCSCLSWDGLFQGLAARTPTVALGSTLFGIVALPWGWLLIASPVFHQNTLTEWLILWALVTPLNHWWFVSNSKAKLIRYFRTLALRPFGEKAPIMASDWSPINWDEESPNRSAGFSLPQE
jgi:ABC-type transport system involved in cytochrome c biogenesis permease component